MRISTPWSAYFTSKKTFRVRAVQENVGPFLKWAGGKRQIAQVIKSYVPKFKRYFEPFLGGGAVFFTVQPMQAVLNDLNSELINVYKVIRDSPRRAHRQLEKTREHCRILLPDPQLGPGPAGILYPEPCGKGIEVYLPQQDLLQRTV